MSVHIDNQLQHICTCVPIKQNLGNTLNYNYRIIRLNNYMQLNFTEITYIRYL